MSKEWSYEKVPLKISLPLAQHTCEFHCNFENGKIRAKKFGMHDQRSLLLFVTSLKELCGQIQNEILQEPETGVWLKQEKIKNEQN